MRIAKYEFDSREVAESKIKGLGVSEDEDGNEYPSHNHCIVKLGHIVLEAAELDQKEKKLKHQY